MERLTIRELWLEIQGKTYKAINYKVDKKRRCVTHEGIPDFLIADKLAEYEDLEEQGKLLKLPCAVGDTYYCIDDGTYPNEWEFINVQQIISCMDKIGKTVFLTRPDAERALAEMEGKK